MNLLILSCGNKIKIFFIVFKIFYVCVMKWWYYNPKKWWICVLILIAYSFKQAARPDMRFWDLSNGVSMGFFYFQMFYRIHQFPTRSGPRYPSSAQNYLSNCLKHLNKQSYWNEVLTYIGWHLERPHLRWVIFQKVNYPFEVWIFSYI